MSTNRKAATWLWVVLGIFGVVLVVGFVVGIGIQVNSALATVISDTDNPSSVALHFTEAIRSQDYTLAYADLANNATLNSQLMQRQTFIKLASDADSERGAVLFYGLVEDNADPAQFSINLRRAKQSYTIHVRLQQVGNVWKISSIDSL